MTQHEALDIAVSVSGKSCISGAATALFGWAADVNWLGVIGATIAILSFASQIYFNVKRDRRESLEHKRRMES